MQKGSLLLCLYAMINLLNFESMKVDVIWDLFANPLCGPSLQ